RGLDDLPPFGPASTTHNPHALHTRHGSEPVPVEFGPDIQPGPRATASRRRCADEGVDDVTAATPRPVRVSHPHEPFVVVAAGVLERIREDGHPVHGPSPVVRSRADRVRERPGYREVADPGD